MTEWKWTGEAGSKPRYEYDALNQLRRRKAGDTVKAQYAYTADGERVYEHNLGTGTDTYVYTIRGLDKQVRRLFTKTQPSGGSATWSFKDHIRRSGQMLASYSPTEGVRHYDLDHLGTVRYVTNRCRQEVAWHAYYGYGEEAEPFETTDMERVRFTGHERDMQGTTGTLDDLDYMHGRYYNPNLGRFLTVDPLYSSILGTPQAWNQYAYCRNNPVLWVDPDGKKVTPSAAIQATRAFKRAMQYLAGGGLGETVFVALDSIPASEYELVMDVDSGNVLAKGQDGLYIPGSSDGEGGGKVLIRGRPSIGLFPPPVSKYPFGSQLSGDQAQAYLLIHEMVHAYLRKFDAVYQTLVKKCEEALAKYKKAKAEGAPQAELDRLWKEYQDLSNEIERYTDQVAWMIMTEETPGKGRGGRRGNGGGR